MMTETVVNVQDAPHNNTATKTSGLEWIKFNLDYFKTLPGIIKILQLLFGIICMSLPSAYYVGATHWFILVATIAFIGTVIWVFIYFLGVREATPNFPLNWLMTEMLNTGICALCYFTAFIVQLCVWVPSYYDRRGANIAAGVFGIFETILYGFGTYLLYIESKRT